MKPLHLGHLIFVVVLGSFGLGADTKPNIAVLLCDDLGYGDLECYGHPHIKTPHLNQLAGEGALFTDFYSAAPVCSPSRVGLLTGRNPNRAGVYDWIPPASSPEPDAREQVHMRAHEVTIPKLLKRAGYATCLAGKWHCNSRFNHPSQPQPNDFGFDHWLATQNNAAPSHANPVNFVRNGRAVGKLEGYSCQTVVDEGVRWLKESRDPGSRFFLYLAFHEPHEPVASPPALVERYRDVARTENEAEYFANVANMDAAVGRFVAALNELGLREETLIIFTSDNGPETLNRYPSARRSYGQPGPLRGMKLHTHEAGFRVAGIMNWPGRIQPGQTINVPVSSLDFLPTFCALAQVEIPSALRLDGAVFLPALTGRPIQRRRPLMWAYYNALNEARVAMRDGRWKVLARLSGGRVPRFENITGQTLPAVKAVQLTDFEIYDITADVGEQVNVAHSHRELAIRLGAKLHTHYQELVESSHVWAPAANVSERP
jgi:arylsulfatase A